MTSTRPRLAVTLVGVVWAIIFSRSEVVLPGLVRLTAVTGALAVTVVLVRSLGGNHGASFLGPLLVFSNLALGGLLILGVGADATPGGLLLMLLVLVQILLFFLLSVTYKRYSDQQQEASSGLLNEKTQQLLYLQQVGIAMNSSEEIKSFLDIVLRATAHVTKAQRVLLFLKSRDGGLSFEAGYDVDGLEGRVIEVVRHPLTLRTFTEGVDVLYPVADTSPAAAAVQGVDAASAALVGGAPFMQLPLIRKDGVWGVFHAEGREDDARVFDGTDLEVFRVLASQISVALENADLYFQMRESYRHTIEALAAAIEAKDAYTSGHSSAVTVFAVPVAREMGITGPELEAIEFAAILHDIGKIAVPSAVLNKPGKLTREEFEDIKRHPAVGAEIIKSVGFLKDSYQNIRHHHERWDGKGYPDGLAGDAIPLGAQIIGVVDTFDAMTSTRSYRKALSEEEAVKEIQRCSGTQFNPLVVQAFLRAYEAGRIHSDQARVDSYRFTAKGSYRAPEGAPVAALAAATEGTAAAAEGTAGAKEGTS